MFKEWHDMLFEYGIPEDKHWDYIYEALFIYIWS